MYKSQCPAKKEPPRRPKMQRIYIWKERGGREGGKG